VIAVGLVVTAAVSGAAWHTERSNEHRLLQEQTKQAAAVVATAIVAIEAPLQTALDVATATAGDARAFRDVAARYTGKAGPFVTASLWRTDTGAPTLLASSGLPPLAPTSAATTQAQVARASRTATVLVTGVSDQSSARVGYTFGRPGISRYVVYAERAIPADRRSPVASNAAFAGLHYATYLGSSINPAALQTTDLPLSRLPLTGGETARATISFGDTTLTLVTASSRDLAGGFSDRLWWIFLVGGLLLTAAASVVAARLVRQRRHAEADAGTISELYSQLDQLYTEQRTVSETLQHALLPQTNPLIPGLEIATRYVAGARGVDVGGDWYSVVRLDEEHAGFVVGDVSGRGVEAAALMARIRFTIRAYLIEGHAPNVALQLCARQVDLRTDGHLATVLVGLLDLRTGQVTLANAGHLPPLLLTESVPRYAETHQGPPLGVLTNVDYPTTSLTLAPGTVLFGFTDGLIERRDEGIDAGMQRLATTAESLDGPVETLITDVLARLVTEDAEDDVAILALRWQPVAALDLADQSRPGAAVR
jgi:serine phosphatase RsbU (regulator of sigma subunit)